MTPAREALKAATDQTPAGTNVFMASFGEQEEKKRRGSRGVRALQPYTLMQEIERDKKARKHLPPFKSGDHVHKTGLYHISHVHKIVPGEPIIEPERIEGQVICLEGGIYPKCKKCGEAATLRLLQGFPFVDHLYIFED